MSVKLNIAVYLDYQLPKLMNCLLQIEAADHVGQAVLSRHLEHSQTDHFVSVSAQDSIGQRTWLKAEGRFICNYAADVQIMRKVPNLVDLTQPPFQDLPAEVVQYLMASRYCQVDELMDFAADTFGNLQGGTRVQAILNWIKSQISYVSGSSTAQTTALDTLSDRQGVCRDFAHVLIALARAAGIPARMVSAYAPHVRPQDFHAVAEVYLDDDWHLVDATGMASADHMAIIGVGRDAADISFLTSYGDIFLNSQDVTVDQT